MEWDNTKKITSSEQNQWWIPWSERKSLPSLTHYSVLPHRRFFFLLIKWSKIAISTPPTPPQPPNFIMSIFIIINVSRIYFNYLSTFFSTFWKKFTIFFFLIEKHGEMWAVGKKDRQSLDYHDGADML